jgi:hypothetical protein
MPPISHVQIGEWPSSRDCDAIPAGAVRPDSESAVRPLSALRLSPEAVEELAEAAEWYRIRTRPPRTVTTAPAESSAPWLASTRSINAIRRWAGTSGKRTRPACAARSANRNSPKSLSIVTSTRASSSAHRRTARSAGSRRRSGDSITSCPWDRSQSARRRPAHRSMRNLTIRRCGRRRENRGRSPRERTPGRP